MRIMPSSEPELTGIRPPAAAASNICKQDMTLFKQSLAEAW